MAGAFEEFGPYAVFERLGQGGMATVHRAEKRGVGFRRPIALKRLLPHVAADPALVKLFVDEARVASHLHHTNVAQTYELGKVGDTFFIAMEYASGPTLAQIIRQCQQAAGDLPLPIIVNILQQVCDALDYAHNLCDDTGQPLRIIHRDVSPANIIVTNTGVVKLIDFGIAKATISSVKTQTGFIKGKFGYIAPEYITGRIDARVDLFAVGVVAHEMMSGRRLFEGKDDFETLQNIRDMNIQPPSRWNRLIPPDLDDVVMTALQRDPAMRWQTAGAMQVALASIARSFGRVVSNQQLAMWVDWAFSQRSGADRVTDLGGDTMADTASGEDTDDAGTPSPEPDFLPGPAADDARGPDSSLSIEISRESASALDSAAPPPAWPAEPATTLHDRPTRVAPAPSDLQRKSGSLRPEPSLEPGSPRPAVRSPSPRPQPAARPARQPTSSSRSAAPQRAPAASPPRESSRRQPSPPRPISPSRAPAPATEPTLQHARQPAAAPPAALRPEPTLPPEPARVQAGPARAPSPRPPGMRLPSDSAETLPVERFALTTGDVELLTPSPELVAAPPVMHAPPAPPPPTPFPRSSRTHEVVAQPAGAAPPGPPSLSHPRPSRSIHAVIPPPLPARPSQAGDAVAAPPQPQPPWSPGGEPPASPPLAPPAADAAVAPRTSAPYEAPRASQTSDAASPPGSGRPSRPMLPFAAPAPPRAAATHDPLAAPPPEPPPPRTLPSGVLPLLPPTLMPSRRDLETLGPPPPVAASQELDVLPRPAPRAPQADAVAPPAPAEPAAAPLPAKDVKRATRSRNKSTKKLPPAAAAAPAAPVAPPDPAAQPSRVAGKRGATASERAAAAIKVRAAAATRARAPAIDDTAPVQRRRRHLVWLILLMIVLGAGAMAVAYYWPDL